MKCKKSIFDEILMRNFENKKNNIALVSEKRSLTYANFLDEVYFVKDYYEKSGVAKGKRVVIFMENCPEFAVSFMALNLCGAVIIPIYVKLGIEKLQSILMFYEPDFIATNDLNYESLTQTQFVIDSFVTGIFIHDEKGSIEINRFGGKSVAILMDDDVAVILSSSGTTSEPKGVMLTNDNIISNTSSIAEYMGVDSDDRILMVKSINHSSSITGELLVGLYAGCTIYIFSGIMHARLVLDSLQQNRISVFFAVPSILHDIIKSRYVESFNLQSLRIIHFYGAVMNNGDMNALLEYFRSCELIYSYGLTEASPRVTYAKKDRLVKYKGASGIALPSVSIRIECDNNEEDSNGLGEIVVKGPNVMRGYFKNPVLTQNVLRNGELYTGDLGYIDVDGNLYVIGRKDNMIIKHGRNIFPEEIERVVSLFDEVSEVLVSGKDEKVIAYVVSNQESINERELIMFCRKKLEDYKVPDKIVRVPKLKKNANNKLLRNADY